MCVIIYYHPLNTQIARISKPDMPELNYNHATSDISLSHRLGMDFHHHACAKTETLRSPYHFSTSVRRLNLGRRSPALSSKHLCTVQSFP